MHLKVTLLLLLLSVICHGQRYEMVKFGDFENWTVRNITESAILGGNTRPIYMVAPTDTVNGNRTFNYSKTIWASSNASAVVAGITKTS